MGLECRNSIESGVLQNATNCPKVSQSAIGLNAEDTNHADLAVETVEELAIGTNRDVQIRGSRWIRSYDGSWQRCQYSLGADGKPGNSRGPCIRGVDPFTIWSDGIPACRRPQSRDACANRSKGSIGRNRVRRDGRGVVASGLAGLHD